MCSHLRCSRRSWHDWQRTAEQGSCALPARRNHCPVGPVIQPKASVNVWKQPQSTEPKSFFAIKNTGRMLLRRYSACPVFLRVFNLSFYPRYSSMDAAATLPAPIALITVAAPVTASPPAKIPSRLVAAPSSVPMPPLRLASS